MCERSRGGSEEESRTVSGEVDSMVVVGPVVVVAV